jgi:transcription elongation factor
MPRAQPKDEEQYQVLRREGQHKEKAARIADASADSSRSATGRTGGNSPAYEDWTKKDLMKRAAEIGIDGRSALNKGELIEALRGH